MPGKQIAATAPRVSFGVELEFFVAYVFEGSPDPDEPIKNDIQPLSVVPYDEEFPDKSKHKIPDDWVREQIRKALIKAGLPVFGSKEKMVPGSVQASHSEKVMSAFRIVDDCSLREFRPENYLITKVEVNSPAMYDMPISFDLIRLAVSTITTQFRCRVNPTCGFHVHVGNGLTERIDPRTLRNFAALLWAADPFISRLHAPWRAITKYSQSARVNGINRVGANEGPSDCLLEQLEKGRPFGFPANWMGKVKYLGRDRWLGESPVADADEDKMLREMEMYTEDDAAVLKSEPWTHRPQVPPPVVNKGPASKPTDEFGEPVLDYEAPVPRPADFEEHRASAAEKFAPPRPRPSPLKRKYPRVPGTMRRDCRDDPDFLKPYLMRYDVYGHDAGPLENPAPRVAPKRTDVMSGVRDLLAADMTSAQIGEMMRNVIGKHINYQFDGYALGYMQTIGAVPEQRETGRMFFNAKHDTVEFREAAGTLDMEWITAWAKICCRLLEWSRDVAPAEYMGVIRLLAWAQEEEGAEGEYDVVDFLVDLGLVTEARVCEERLHKGDAVFWECMNFEPDPLREGAAMHLLDDWETIEANEVDMGGMGMAEEGFGPLVGEIVEQVQGGQVKVSEEEEPDIYGP
ncbi:hypothetical protein COL154_010244 [Colletotrichum chrysophilum]|uniref:uncharacterized protein n=1 Tax=Colletotrichum chrysophilum TaxID=1836956 RepID=UPI002301174B|nr:uncharacterized protein COL26b_008245 [Colletotrichum chrysophilum]KAJ0339780.1 hypothetical protein KNSL1_011848 [Colletotrichum chrysophilum]KAJ0357358.1 hypothetical protein COL154_010244 [Colletotrichum chrysophilum]KAJ0373524.1 hypothetical protein COL26b_008245 [Colletotrichum chrysophilum]